MIRRNRTKQKLIVIAIFLGMAALYNEYLVYDIKSIEWPTKQCSECVKVLLVADPQLLGEVNENYFGAWFARWDSDRYIAKTFSRALSHSQPDVIAFLGDLMDEGHIANNKQFVRYKQRFDNIFYTPEHIMKIYIPGDNDIGGEDSMVSSQIHDRFKFAYAQYDTLTVKNLIFFKVNKLTRYMPNAPKNAFLNDYTERNTTNVVLSHLPLLFTPDTFVKNVIKELSPQVIFTAHNHKAMHMSLDTTIDQLSESRVLPPHNSQLYRLRLDMGDIHELQMPTCSYRMGTRFMGYGLAYIDTPDKSVEFTILWLPERFTKLWGYLICLGIVLVMCICTSSCCATSTHAAYNHLSSI